jgi:hypothetical protein
MGRTLSYLARLVILVCSMAAGCGGDEDPAASSTTVDWSGYCDDRAALQCPKFDAVACKEQETCARALIRDDIEGPMVECLLGACPFESCLMEVSKLPMSPAGEAFLNACAERVTECGLGDDTCFAGDLSSDEGIGELDACLDLATCDDTDTCMSTYFETQFATCEAWH